MLTVSITAFGVAAALLLECILRQSDFFSPSRLYIFFQCIAIGVAFLALNAAMTPFQPFTTIVYLGSSACFLAGTLTARLLNGLSKKNLPLRALDLKRYNWKLHLLFSSALFAFFVSGMCIAYLGAGEFPLFAKDKINAIEKFFQVRWYSSVALSYGGVTMCLFFMAIFRPQERAKFFNFAFWMTAVSVLIFSLALSRSGLMFFAAFGVVFYNEAIRRISIAKIFLLFVLFSMVILVTGYLKINAFKEENKVKIKTSQIISTALGLPYLYLANNYWNLDYALNPENYQERHPTTYGYTILSGFLSFVIQPGGGTLGQQLEENGDFETVFHEKSIKIKGLNTIGYQWDLYKDFGVFGTFVVTFLIGLALGILYLKMRSSPTLLNTAVYSYLTFFIADSCFGLFFEAPVYVYGLFYVAICCYLCERTFLNTPPRIPIPSLLH